jgi:hypothetical protein
MCVAQVFMIEGTLDQLGLDSPQFESATGCDPVDTVRAGFTSNVALLAHLEAKCPECFSPTAADSKLICAANASVAVVDGYSYDRRSHHRWRHDTQFFHVREGQNYTTVAFFGSRPEDTYSATYVNISAGGNFSQHINFDMRVVRDDGAYTGITVEYPFYSAPGVFEAAKAADHCENSQHLFHG